MILSPHRGLISQVQCQGGPSSKERRATPRVLAQSVTYFLWSQSTETGNPAIRSKVPGYEWRHKSTRVSSGSWFDSFHVVEMMTTKRELKRQFLCILII